MRLNEFPQPAWLPNSTVWVLVCQMWLEFSVLLFLAFGLSGYVNYHNRLGFYGILLEPSEKFIAHLTEMKTHVLPSYSAGSGDAVLLFSEFLMLLSAAAGAPANPYTGRKHIMYTFFSGSHVAIGLAHVCSAVSVGIPAPALLIVALDLVAFQAVRGLWTNVVVRNWSHHLTFMKVCLLKQAILEVLLGCGCEVTTFDADTVFLKNPCDVFMRGIVGYDFTFQHDVDFVPTYFEPNIGCYTVAPSNLTLSLVALWSTITRNITHEKFRIALDQIILRDLLRSGRVIQSAFKYRFVMTQLRKFSMDRPILIRFFDGKDMSSFCQALRMNRKILAKVQDLQPYVMHLACLVGLSRKLRFMDCAGYSFVDKNGRCLQRMSNITFSKIFYAAHTRGCR
jgi:hypothetical protein